MPASLPEFGNPPVREVAISIQFSPLTKWQGPHAGLFWSEIKNDYPKTQVLPPIAHVTENFEELSFQVPSLNIQFDPDSQRFWFLSELWHGISPSSKGQIRGKLEKGNGK